MAHTLVKEIEDLKVSISLLETAIESLSMIHSPAQMDLQQKNIMELTARVQLQAGYIGNGVAPLTLNKRTEVITEYSDDYIDSILNGSQQADNDKQSPEPPHDVPATYNTPNDNSGDVPVNTKSTTDKPKAKGKRGRKPANKDVK